MFLVFSPINLLLGAMSVLRRQIRLISYEGTENLVPWTLRPALLAKLLLNVRPRKFRLFFFHASRCLGLFCISHIIVCLTILLFFVCVTTACNVSLRRPRSLRHTLRSRMLLLLIYHTLCCNVCSVGDRGSLLQGSDAATCYGADPNTLAVHSFR